MENKSRSSNFFFNLIPEKSNRENKRKPIFEEIMGNNTSELWKYMILHITKVHLMQSNIITNLKSKKQIKLHT